jgi:hypothetical protein
LSAQQTQISTLTLPLLAHTSLQISVLFNLRRILPLLNKKEAHHTNHSGYEE